MSPAFSGAVFSAPGGAGIGGGMLNTEQEAQSLTPMAALNCAFRAGAAWRA